MRKVMAGAAGYGIGGDRVLLVTATDGLDRVELILYDWRMRTVARNPPDVHADIVLVEINDTTIRDLDPVFGRWPWPRVAFSMIVDFLNRAPAKVIAEDRTSSLPLLLIAGASPRRSGRRSPSGSWPRFFPLPPQPSRPLP